MAVVGRADSQVSYAATSIKNWLACSINTKQRKLNQSSHQNCTILLTTDESIIN
jgi:hypothetical protein